MRLRARRRVCSRGERGRLVRCVRELSVRSMESWSCSRANKKLGCLFLDSMVTGRYDVLGEYVLSRRPSSQLLESYVLLSERKMGMVSPSSRSKSVASVLRGPTHLEGLAPALEVD
jgi:hypothetical protein